ncbi:rhomboid family intramembrane serine protease [Phycicoccus endophyticus]|uniref:rhomboid family intramembrane serine protease n=1 Tax=Phycicoccus endophyticus TaxID=1690220 RepID=UPI001998B32F|nr:rhomboid family intramembrane serine protease [Phycicoccus endophyticus]GGL40209.1 rhomboid family intramembrane serine protease [Phycicoccus endophyticus]
MAAQPPIPPSTPDPGTPGSGQVPVCPRHPDRESYVRCQRCGRPACPECQRPAAVGIQCVDCVREGARTVRQGRTVFGGAPTDGRPLVTMWVIGICVVVFVLQQLVPGLTGRISFVPVLGDSQPWRFLSSGFAHGGLTHIAFNMYALWVMGQYLEPLLGRARFAALYLLSAVGGSVGLLLLASPQTVPECLVTRGAWCTSAVGASGAVFGLFGAFLVLQRRLGRSAAGMYVVIGLNAVIGFVLPNIAWQAHLGGLVTGAAAAGIVGYLGGRRSPAEQPRRTVHWLGLGALLALLVVLAVAKYALA